MEHLLTNQPTNGTVKPLTVAVNNTAYSTSQPFITANTMECTLQEMQQRHIIPVFLKDNEPLMSHTDFIEVAGEVVSDVFQRETILRPSIRVSHPIKGRIPEAKHKAASELQEWEKTLYYERMAFVIEVPSIHDDIGGNTLSLTIGGVKAYNLNNLNARKGSEEHFTFFIGFQNKVCTNLCVWSDGFSSDIRVKSLSALRDALFSTITSYSATAQLLALQALQGANLAEHQFAHLLGKLRMYPFLPSNLKSDVPELGLTDTQLSLVVKDYYKDNSFCREGSGDINLWRLYNLFTGANKSSYIDSFLERSVSVYGFVSGIEKAMKSKTGSWYLTP